MSATRSLSPIEERIADAAGPIVVKEVRQGLRARLFVICFSVVLTACFAMALLAAAETDRTTANLGPKYFGLFLGALVVVELFIIPYAAYRSMAREREDETWVLLTLTGLGPRRVVRGKVASACAQGGLYASAIAPFVLFSYYLNGVDLPSLLVALTLVVATSQLLVALAVAAGTLGQLRIIRGLVHFAVLGGLGVATLAGVGVGSEFAEFGPRMLNDVAGRAAVAGVVLWAITTAVLVHEGAASELTLPTENAAKGPRLALAGQVLFATAAGVFAMYVFEARRELAGVGSIVTSLLVVLPGFFVVSEQDGAPPAFRTAGGLLRPGALRGYVVLLGLLAVSTGAWLAAWHFSPSVAAYDSDDRMLHALLAAPLYVALYLSLGAFAGRVFPLNRLESPVATRFATAGFVVVGILVPPLFALALRDRPNDRDFNVLNPAIGLVNFIDRFREEAANDALMLLAAMTLGAVFVCSVTLIARDQERTT